MTDLQQTIDTDLDAAESAETAALDDKASRSLRKSVNNYCKSCTYDPESGLGTWREQVELCTVTKCPLYAVRPLPKRRAVSALSEDESQL